MIFIIAGSYGAAKKWAEGQHLDDTEWFSTLDLDDLKRSTNFHVVVLDSAAELTPIFFEKVWRIAQQQGRIGRE
jgi:predicted O-methyltransferase YrrM